MTKAELIAYMLETLPAFTPETLKGYSVTAPLTGDTGVLDSLGLVTFCFEVEQWVAGHSTMKITLVNDRMLAEEPSPYRSLDTLADAVLQQIRGGCDG